MTPSRISGGDVVHGLKTRDWFGINHSNSADYGPTLDLTMSNDVGEQSFIQVDAELAEQLLGVVTRYVTEIRERGQ